MRRLLMGFAFGFIAATWLFSSQKQAADEELRRRARGIADEAGEVARQLRQ